MQALMSHTSDRLFEFYANHGNFFQAQEYDKRPIFLTTVNYMKKVYEKAKIKLRSEDLEVYEDSNEKNKRSARTKTIKKPKYRLC